MNGLLESIERVSVRSAEMASWQVSGGMGKGKVLSSAGWRNRLGNRKKQLRGPGGPRNSRPGGRRYGFISCGLEILEETQIIILLLLQSRILESNE